MTKEIRIPARFKGWDHVLLDIVELPGVDVVADARELTSHTGRYDAVYCAHNLEHFTPDEVPIVLKGFLHVLHVGGFAEIHVPDGDQIDQAVFAVGMHGTAYMSREGPVTPYDMIHGHQGLIAKGNPYMEHHIVFYRPTLAEVRTRPLAWELEARGWKR